jgi:hypothetical protein
MKAVDFVALDTTAASRHDRFSRVGSRKDRPVVSERIKRSLQAAKARGIGPGNPEIALARPKAVQSASDKAQAKDRP